MDDESLPPLLVRVIEALAAGGSTAGGAVAGAAVGGPLGAPAGAVAGATTSPMVAGLIIQGIERVRHRRMANATEAMSYAASKAQLEPKELLDSLLSTPNRQELLATALESAVRATLQAKIKALGEALRTGALAATDAEVDHELLFVRAMADFEAAHIAVLGHLAQRATFASGGSSPIDVIAQLPGVGSAATPVIATLERHGAIEPVPLDIAGLFGDFYDNMPSIRTAPLPGMPRLRPGGPVPPTPPRTWRITAFGTECLERLGRADNSITQQQ